MVNVYLISSELDGKNLYKIGFTRREIQVRINEFKTGNASPFILVDSFQSKWGTKIEAHLHKFYRSKKISGEWFDLTEDDVLQFRERCQKFHDNLELVSTTNSYYLERGDF